MRKYASWSMAQGIRQGMSKRPPKGMWKQEGKDGLACTAGNALLPMLSDIVNPKIARLCKQKRQVHRED